ncbi:MAG: DUF3489 domain-containing protein [Bryobacteraceae bacterium]
MKGRTRRIRILRHRKICLCRARRQEGLQEQGTTPRDGCKKQFVLELLQRKDGATMAQIAKATAWQNHGIRGFISVTLKTNWA